MKRPLIVALAAGLAGAANGAPDRDAARADLVRAVAAYDQATVSNDVRRLGALVRDDYVLVNSDMSVQGKASYLADFKVPGFRIGRYHMTEPLLILRADSALTGGLVHLSWLQAGQRYERDLRVVHFWLRTGGRWRLAYSQLTRRPS